MAFADVPASLIFTFTAPAGASCYIERCNAKYLSIFDLDSPAPLTITELPLHRVDAEHQSELYIVLNQLIHGERHFVEQSFSITHDTQKHWFLLQATAAADNPNKEFRATIFAVSRQFAQQQCVINSANFFMRLLDQLPDRFYYKDRQSRYLGGNKAWRDQHQISDMHDWLGKTDFDSPKFYPGQAEQLFAEEQMMMESGIAIRTRESRERKDGRIDYADSIKTPVYDNHNQIIGLVGLTRDITQQVKTEQALAFAKQQAEQATQAKSAFLAMMSHEIRTPMNGVMGCTSLLAETTLNEEQQQLVKTIRSCSEGLLVIINDILDYSKIEAGQIQLNPHPFELRELIENVLEVSNKSIAHKHIDVNYFIAPNVPLHLEGDSTRLRQVLLNLVGNAIKFTERGAVNLRIQLQEKNESENHCKLLFSVKDTGIGITEEQRAHLFQVFSQADNSITRKYGGTGLGLAISKKIIEQMNGNIWLRSTPEKGSTFFFNAQFHFDAKQPTKKTAVNSSSKLPRTTQILVVEDNSVNQIVIVKMLSKLGYVNITAVADGTEAVDLCRKIPIDIILMDIQMCTMDGYTATEKIRAQQNAGTQPWIVALTAGIQQADTERAFATGMNAFATKPIQLQELDRILKQAESPMRPNTTLFKPS